MSVADRLPEPLARVWEEEDFVKILALLGLIYAVYLAIGMTLGYGIRAQLNSIAALTFYVGVFALLSLALNIHWGYTGLFNIGIVGFMAIGIYTLAVLSKAPAAAQEGGRVGGFGLPLWVGIIGGVVAAALFGAVVALPALRLRADYLAIVTIAFSEIVRFTLLENTFKVVEVGNQVVGLGGGSGLILDFDPTDAFLQATGLWDIYLGIVDAARVVMPTTPKAVVDSLFYSILILVFVAGAYALLNRLGNSPFGRVLKAIREDEEATQALGKNTNVFKTKSFMVGCALMGLGGILWYMEAGAITPNTFRPRLTFFIWIALIIGGAGSNTGSVMGGAVFAAVLFQGPRYLQNVVGAYIQTEAPSSFGEAMAPITQLDVVPFFLYTIDNVRQLQLVFMGLVLIWLMQNRPQGMLGHRKEEAASIPLNRPAASDDTAPATAADGGAVRNPGGDRDE
jgi:branched-chain amino acid transport system permease protein